MANFVVTKRSINIVKHRWYYIGFSILILLPLLVVMIYASIINESHSPFKLGIDFTGGTILEYGFDKTLTNVDVDKVETIVESFGLLNPVIQLRNVDHYVNPAPKQMKEQVKPSGKASLADDLKTNQQQDYSHLKSILSIRAGFISTDKEDNKLSTLDMLNHKITQQIGAFVPMQTIAIGPTLSKELLTNSLFALFFVFLGILSYISFRFQFDYAVCAIVALAHDALFVCGAFSLFGLLFHTEINSLFMTGILTVIGFSVHDTIVVFDRLRENVRFLSKKKSFGEIANDSVNQTLARSINTSLTTVITLTALFIFGGESTKDFVLCMLLGIIVGTYSSIFVASPLLLMWREKIQNKKKPGKGKLSAQTA